MSSSVSSWFGWGKKPEENKESVEVVQEGIPVVYDHIEESKGDEPIDEVVEAEEILVETNEH